MRRWLSVILIAFLATNAIMMVYEAAAFYAFNDGYASRFGIPFCLIFSFFRDFFNE